MSTVRGSGGSVYQRGRIWWIKYYVNGRPIRESARTERAQEARNLLIERLGAVARGAPLTPGARRLTVRELLESVHADYAVNGKRSLERLGYSIAPLVASFGDRRAVALTTREIRQYILSRQRAGMANATINRELAALKRGFTLAHHDSLVPSAPFIPTLDERNVRTGFFEAEQFLAVRRHLPAEVQPVVTFAYLTGWRVQSEVLRLQWPQVDFRAGVVRLEPGTTKNDEGRLFPLIPELRASLEAQRERTRALERKLGQVIPWVFHRQGQPIQGFRRSWRTACRKAGCPGRIPHDFRRTAVRNLERSGVSRSVAMKLTGHRTESVYRRYAIVSEGDLREAGQKLTGTISGTLAEMLKVSEA